MNAKEKFKKDYSVYRILLRRDYELFSYDFTKKFEEKYTDMNFGFWDRTHDILSYELSSYRYQKEPWFSYRMEHYKSLKDGRLP